MAAAIGRLPAGGGVVVRHTDDRARRDLAKRLQPLCRARRLWLLIAGDWRLAAALRANGVHAPEAMIRRGLPPGLRLWLRTRNGRLTAAAHSEIALRRAARARADAVMVGPVLPTASHPDRAPLGRVRFAALARAASRPAIALGGIGPDTMRQLNGIGCWGAAGVGFAGRAIRT
ncbi:MAG: thiamine phosphate synthase [Rhodospirillaceae bacterium]|nr:thiamine phosphate synthase [Rhodospirillaceae bacterium]